MKLNYVNKLSNLIGQEIKETFVLQSITSNTNTNGEIRYDCVLSDNSGSIFGTVWNDHINPAYLQMQGSVVEVHGMVRLFQGSLQISIVNINLEESYDINCYIFSMPIEIMNAAKKQIQYFIGTIKNETLFRLIDSIYHATMFKKLSKSPASLKSYFAYNGGALQMISIKTILAARLYDTYSTMSNECNVDYDLLISAALLQDIGCIFVYNPFPIASRTEKGELSSIAMQSLDYILKAKFTLNSKDANLDENILFQLEQLIVSNDKQNIQSMESLILSHSDNTCKSFSAYNDAFIDYDKLHPIKREKKIYSKYFNSYIYRRI